MDWRPATIDEVKRIVRDGLASCNSDLKAAFAKYRVEPYYAPIARLDNLERVVVVAQKQGRVIYWEDVEEGFGVSPISAEGQILEQDCNQNELSLALSDLVKGGSGGEE